MGGTTGLFPSPRTETGNLQNSREAKNDEAKRRECLAFYKRWCLDRMLTWDLPAPLDVGLHYAAGEGPLLTMDEGVTLLLPWYTLRGGQFDLQEVIRRIRFEATPLHLKPWVSSLPDTGKKLIGEISYQRHIWALPML